MGTMQTIEELKQKIIESLTQGRNLDNIPSFLQQIGTILAERNGNESFVFELNLSTAS